MNNGFENLEVWKRSTALAVRVCKQAESIRSPGLRDQIIRSAVSVPSNIAEGAERLSQKEFVQFLSYARGSAGELRTQLMISAQLGYIREDVLAATVNESIEIGRMLSGLIRSQTNA